LSNGKGILGKEFGTPNATQHKRAARETKYKNRRSNIDRILFSLFMLW